MYIKDATYRSVPTADLTFPIAEGTVVTVGNVTGIVDQNLKEAAPTARIYVAVGGTIDLTSDANKNVTFSDEDISRLGQDFNFIPGAEGGGGSSLPEYTSSDVGKVLTVGDDAEHSTTVTYIPEQTITFENNMALIPNVSLSPEDLSLGMEAEMTLVIGTQTITNNMTVVSIGADAIGFQDSLQYYTIGYSPNDEVWAIRMTTLDVAYSGDATILMTASIPSVAPVWGRSPVNILALSNRAVMDLQSTFTSTLMSMASGGKESIVSSEANFSTTDDREAVLAAIENGVNGVISVIDIFGSKLIIPSYTVGENEGSLVFDVPLYTLFQNGAEYRLRITVKIAASLPGKLEKFAYTIAIEQIDYSAK